ncbi:TonB-dependent receptor [Pseudoalteromonas lipolytica SCSIO 04301]|uniref:TonB-dependent receptor n=1 Tax=Pseudoalteromonas TaxID=53246 RepID=UPI0004526A3C|nr:MULTISPECIES: TonB-dependent receptor [Pseudoalteromonas]EWH07977.1 TonB-dependent receptor [Pseudoalteromonas lipolytica SCSIO 04301]MCC9660154.1 TonB-dependent receptor [Pseudoalteromonas sp. MB41]
MNHTLFKKKQLAISLSMAMGLSALVPHSAAAEEKSEKASDIEVIQVSGIRGSLVKSMDIKRQSAGVVDAITSEDIGKFPDTNLAESLQRITGVSIDRSNGEGSKITVRGFGPEFNLVTLNNRQMPTTGGRSFDFGDIATESVSGVEVYKTARSDIPSGGIGATVNITTAKPLSNPGLKASIGAKAVHDTSNETGDNITPEVSGIYSNTFNDDRFGVLISGSVQERNNREQAMAVDNWIPNVDISSSPDLALTDNNQRADGATWYPQNAGYAFSDNTRKRTNGQLVLQYAPTDRITATLDYTYSKLEFEKDGRSFGVWFNNGGNVSSANINENGTYTKVTEIGGDYSTNLNRGATENENKSLGLNIDWQVTDNLNIEFDAHNSSAESAGVGLGHDAFMIIGNTSCSWCENPTVNIDEKMADFSQGEIPLIDMTLTNGQAELLPSDMGTLFAGVNKDTNTNDLDQYQLKGTWYNENTGALSSINFGVSHTKVDFRTTTAYSGQLAAGWWLNSADWYDDSMFTRVDSSGLLDGFSGGGSDKLLNYYYDADFDEIVAIAESIDCDHPDGGIGACSWPADVNGKVQAGPIDDDHRVSEETTAFYAQANFETEFNGMPINITAGLRYESTDVTANSLERPAVAMEWVNGNEWSYIYADERTFSNGEGSTKEFLPNIDMNIEVVEDVIARFSYSRTLARPPVGALRSTTSFLGNPKVGQRKVAVGNPNLKPYTADNIDLSLEYYYGEGSYVSAGYYRKQVDNFLVNITTEETIDGITDPFIGDRAEQAREDLAAAGEQPSDQAIHDKINENQGTEEGTPIVGNSTDPLANFFVSRDNNVETANLWGWELAAQHMFGETGFGIAANATFVFGDVEADRDAIGYQFALPGLSDSANFSAIYDLNGLSARISYNWRDEFLTGFDQHSSPVFTESYGQWDINVNYAVNEKLTVFVEGLNLTDETQRTYVRYSEQLLRANQYGARYNIGFRYSF